MSYSKIIDPVIKIKEQRIDRLADGSSVVYYTGVMELKKYRLHWINTEELQQEINTIESVEAGSDWIIGRSPVRTPVHDTLADLFNVTIDLHRYVNE